MKYLGWHWSRLNRKGFYPQRRDAWIHVCWLVTQEKHAMLKWEDGEWVRK